MKGNNVVINPIETESYNKVESIKKGFGGSIGLTGETIGYGKDKLSTAIKNKADNPSEITLAQNIDIEASNKVNVKAIDIYAKENIEIKVADEEHKSSNKSSSSGASIRATFDVTAPISVTLSTSGAKGRENGISYVNSTMRRLAKMKN